MNKIIPFPPKPGTRFQRHYEYEAPMCFNHWEWNDTFNRWGASVTFYDGARVFTYPERQPETRTLTACYHTASGKVHEVSYELAFYTLGWLTRSCWKLARERGYGRGQLRFKFA